MTKLDRMDKIGQNGHKLDRMDKIERNGQNWTDLENWTKWTKLKNGQSGPKKK